MNECDAEDSPCGDDEFCTNTEGSYSCTKCDKSCSMCTGPGADKCTACAPKYYKNQEGRNCMGKYRNILTVLQIIMQDTILTLFVQEGLKCMF